MLRAERLTGRDLELVAVMSFVERVRSGVGGALFVSGEAGVGKSALLRAALGEGEVIRSRATPPAAPTFRPLVELALGAVERGARPDDERLRLHRSSFAALLPGVMADRLATELPTPIRPSS